MTSRLDPEIEGWIEAARAIAQNIMHSDLRLIPLAIGAATRALISAWLPLPQAYIDLLIGALFLVAFVYFLVLTLRSSTTVGRNCITIITHVPITILGALGLLLSAVVLWTLYEIARYEYPREYETAYQAGVLVCAFVVKFCMRIGGMFLRTVPGG